MAWIRRLIASFRPQRLDQQLDDELQFHLDQRTGDLIAQGWSADSARSEAARMFGNRALLHDTTRDRDVLIWLQTTLQDLRFAARTLRRNPGFAAAAVLSLALGIGGNTALFSLLNGLLLKRLPASEPEQLVRLRDGQSGRFTYPDFQLLRTRSRLLVSVLGSEPFSPEQPVEERGATVPATVETVSGEYFDTLGVSAPLGRVFHAADAKSGGGAIAVITDSYWRRHYGVSPAALGAHFRRGPSDYTVVGVAPPGFRGVLVDAAPDIWLLLEQNMAPGSPVWTRGRLLEAIGRMRPGVTLERVAAEMHALFRRPIVVEPGGTGISPLRSRFSRPLLALECVVCLVLLIACANLANLMLASAASRAREIAVRQAIGAGRGRLVRQLLTESLLVSALGGGSALFVARWLSAALLRFLPPDAAPAIANLGFHIDARVLGFAALLSLATCLLFGLAPAVRATRPSSTSGLKDTPGAGRASARWTSQGLVVCEVAMCTLLLMAACLFVKSLVNLRSLDSGFAPEHALIASFDLPREYQLPKRFQIFEQLRLQLAASPGVSAAGYSHIGPLSGFGITGIVSAQGHTAQPEEETTAYDQTVSPGFLAAVGTPLLAGRDFTGRDDARMPAVAIVNESFARRFFGQSNPIGRRFGTDGPASSGTIEIVGLVRDTKWINLRDKAPAMYYRPCAQEGIGFGTLALRASGNLTAVAANLLRVAHSIDGRLILKDVVPFTEIEDRTIATERMAAYVSAAFGLLALLVACVGLYGVLSYGVARRTREIGVRMALGASRAGVQWMVLRESLVLLAAGFAMGIPAALGASRWIASMLFGLTPADPATLTAALAILLVVSIAAAYVPARRAASVDPMTALRYE